jgi:hypothetical protein
MEEQVVGWPEPALVVIWKEWILSLWAIFAKASFLSIGIKPPHYFLPAAFRWHYIIFFLIAQQFQKKSGRAAMMKSV